MRTVAVLLLVTGAAAADKPPATPDPDKDDSRLVARPAPTNTALNDSLDPTKGDAVDWRAFDLGGKPGLATVTLNWDAPTAQLSFDLQDAMGVRTCESPTRQGLQTSLKALCKVDAPGPHYLAVRSLAGATVYSLRVKWDGPSSAPDAGTPQPAPTDGGLAPPIAPGTIPDDANHPRGRVVSSFRDEGVIILYLDRGTAAGLKVGMWGTLLDGASGDKQLEGGDFLVTKVIDATHAVAQAKNLVRVGKNSRFGIDLVGDVPHPPSVQ
jgi:hypothetical protein